MDRFYKLHPNVEIEEGAQIGDYVIIGIPPRGFQSGELPTIIGRNAIIRSHSIIYSGNKIGDNFQTGHHTIIRESNVIGNDVSVGTNSVLEHSISIANRIRIHSNAFIPEYSILADDCWIGPNVVFTNAVYPKSPNVKETLKGPRIGKNAKIGANATLLPGIIVGDYSLVGAGSVVTKNVGERCVVVGNPAREINKLDDLPY